MAAITFDKVGVELTQVRAENPSPLAPIESGARVLLLNSLAYSQLRVLL